MSILICYLCRFVMLKASSVCNVSRKKKNIEHRKTIGLTFWHGLLVASKFEIMSVCNYVFQFCFLLFIFYLFLVKKEPAFL